MKRTNFHKGSTHIYTNYEDSGQINLKAGLDETLVLPDVTINDETLRVPQFSSYYRDTIQTIGNGNTIQQFPTLLYDNTDYKSQFNWTNTS